jgi:hypothetical protein
MLKRGGGKQGRRYQQEPNFFLLYKLTMQQKIGGIALKAEDVKLDNLDLPETITIGEVKAQRPSFSLNRQIFNGCLDK